MCECIVLMVVSASMVEFSLCYRYMVNALFGMSSKTLSFVFIVRSNAVYWCRCNAYLSHCLSFIVCVCVCAEDGFVVIAKYHLHKAKDRTHSQTRVILTTRHSRYVSVSIEMKQIDKRLYDCQMAPITRIDNKNQISVHTMSLILRITLY